ncbi:MAG TPA: hypothetical protein VEB66_07765 [Opitutaceae bacterium]|nr:hypothetical protein [Opitutaceae bacterium]
MRAPPVLRLLPAALFALAAGCASPTSPDAIMDRVDANRAEYEAWPLNIKEAVLDGRVIKGMDRTMVLVARGKPTEVVDRGSGDEVWVYRTGGGGSSGSSLMRGTTVSIGAGSSGGYPGYPSGYPGGGYPGGYPGTGITTAPIVLGSGGSGGSYEPVEEHEIVFRDGLVVRGDGPKPVQK